MRLYNSLTRKIEEFEPINKNNVKMYSCGLTVYDKPHLGHGRTYIAIDILYRLLCELYGKEHVVYVRNITDVDDKINKRAVERGISIQEVSEENIKFMDSDFEYLHLLKPNVEPRATEHIEDMIKYLNKMGAKINGAGTDKVEIVGVKKLSEISYNIMPDRIETGTYLVAGAITNGNIKLLNVNSKHIEPILNKLDEVNCKLNISNNEIEIIAPKRVKAVDIKTMPYPGFPTDMQSVFSTILTVSKGTSVIVENIFESRYKYAQELIRMGAKINVEGRIAIIKGTKKIQGTNVVATDLRGGASLVIAGLYANGVTQIDNIHYILRGYEKMDEKLKKVGAKIYIEK